MSKLLIDVTQLLYVKKNIASKEKTQTGVAHISGKDGKWQK